MARRNTTADTTMNTNTKISIKNLTNAEREVLKTMFKNRISFDDAVDAPPKPTREEAILAWGIDKYGTKERFFAVKEMAKIVRVEWQDQKKKTGVNVVTPENYKNELYAEALRRVLKAEANEKKRVNKLAS